MPALGVRNFLTALLDLRRPFALERFGRTALRPSWCLEQRRVPEHYLTVGLEGEADVAAGPVSGVFGPGSVFVVAPDVPHSIHLRGGRMTFYHCRFTLGASRRPLCLATAAHLVQRPGQVRAHMDAAWDASRRSDALARLRLRALLAAVLAESLGGDDHNTEGLDARQRQAVQALVTTCLPAPIHPRDLARTCGLSHDYFTRRFRMSFGIAPRSWLLQERLRHAAEEVVGSDDALGSIAERWGFASLFLFSRHFSAHFAMSPSRYRRRFRG